MRAAKAFGYLTRGYHQDLATVANNAVFDSDNPGVSFGTKYLNFIRYVSIIYYLYGVAHVGYLPDGKVLGLSKSGTHH